MYRFEKLDHFEQSVSNEELTFVSPFWWPDMNEGILLRALFSPSGMDDVMASANEILKNPGDVNFLVGVLEGMRTTFFAQCWTRCEGNSSLWENKDVRIEIDREDIAKLDSVNVRDVEYVDSVTIKDGLRRLNIEHYVDGRTHIDLLSVISVKHKRFSYEQEVRLVVQVPENVNRDTRGGVPPWLVIFEALYRQGKMSKGDFESTLLRMGIANRKIISFSPIENFIKSVMVNRSASPEVEVRVQKLCQQHSIRYLGRWEQNGSRNEKRDQAKRPEPFDFFGGGNRI